LLFIKTNKSAARVIDVLSLLAKAHKPLTLSDICREIDIPMSSAFELMYTLVEKDAVEIDSKEIKTFKLGMKLFEIGASVIENLDLHKISRPILEELSFTTGETVFLAVADKADVVYLDRVQTKSSINTSVSLGARNTMHTTGVGKALLSTYSNEKVAQLLGEGELLKKNAFSIGHYKDLIVELDCIRQRGYSIDNRENELDIFCVGAPIFDRECNSIAAISISSIFTKMTDDHVQYLGQLVVDAALLISKKLGFISK